MSASQSLYVFLFCPFTFFLWNMGQFALCIFGKTVVNVHLVNDLWGCIHLEFCTCSICSYGPARPRSTWIHLIINVTYGKISADIGSGGIATVLSCLPNMVIWPFSQALSRDTKPWDWSSALGPEFVHLEPKKIHQQKCSNVLKVSDFVEMSLNSDKWWGNAWGSVPQIGGTKAVVERSYRSIR